MPASITSPQTLLTPERVKEGYAALLAALPAPDAPKEAWLACFDRWEALKRQLDGAMHRLSFQERQDTRNAEARAAMKHVREQIAPLQQPFEAELRAAFLAAGCREALAERLGAQWFVVLEVAQAAYHPANVPLVVKEEKLIADYTRKMGEAVLRVGDEELTHTQVKARLADPDDAVRRAAWAALSAWMDAEADDFHARYDALIAVRHEMARNMGEASFVPLAYRRLGRSDYDPADVAVFREEIRQHVVPVVSRFRAWQAAQLGTAEVLPADAAYVPGLSLPSGVVPVETQLERADALFERLDGRLSAHFRTMMERGLIDLPTRPGKATGAFCTVFEDAGEAAIFCNSTGDAQDVVTLMHEMGHAFQVWESLPIEAMDLRWPGMDAAEVLSMGLELLALREIGAFFTPAMAARYRRFQFVTVLERLPYMAVVDAFQHWVYEHPTHTHAEREATWDALWHAFMPGVNYRDHGNGHRTRWMRQPHVYQVPFYYIDYALAQAGALQLWARAEDDHAMALEAYLDLCRLGGTQPLVAFFESAGLVSPFTPGLLGPLMERVAAELGV